MVELKPCSCGCTDFSVKNQIDYDSVPQYVVTCKNCFKRSSPRSTKNRARKEWNRMVEDETENR